MEAATSQAAEKGITAAFGRSSRGWWVWRALAATVMAVVLVVLYWGAFLQEPRPNPFHTPDFTNWLRHKLPHPGYTDMPVRPVGSLAGFVPRDLCAEGSCAGLDIQDDGRALLHFENRVEILARVRHTASGHLFAISQTGKLWQLNESRAREWALIEQPAYLPEGAWEVYTAANSSLPDDRVLALATDAEGVLWVATPGGLARLHEGAWEMFSAANSALPGNEIRALATGAERALWVGTDGGLARLHEGTWVYTAANSGLPSDQVLALATGADGALWVGTDGGLARLHEGLWDVYTPANSDLPADVVAALATGPDGALWVGTDGGLAHLHEGAWEVYTAAEWATALAIGADGALWVGTRGGLARLHEGAWEVYTAANSDLAADIVPSLATGPDGALWVGTTSGLTWLKPSAALSGPVSTDAALDQTGALWIVGRNGYAVRAHPQGFASAGKEIEDDLFGIAALPGGDAVAVGANGLFVRLSAPQSEESQQTPLAQQAEGVGEWWGERSDLAQAQQQQQQQQVQIEADDPAFGIPGGESFSDSAGSIGGDRGGGGPTTSDGEASRLIAAVSHIEAAGDATLRAVRFLDDKRGWIAGDRGLLLHTGDGGETWQVLHGQWPDGNATEEPVTYALMDLHVQAADGPGWAVGETPDGRRTVLAAEDAGDPATWRELPHYIAPWWFFLGIQGFILAGFLNAWAWRLEPPPPEASITGAATSDKPLSWSDPGARVLRPLARGLSRFLRNASTEPPLTVAITGRWGSGKSSLMNLLEEDLARVGARPVWFNAWHHREEEHLLAALFQAVRRQGPPGWWLSSGLGFRIRLLLRRGRATFINASFLLLFAAVIYVTVRVSLPRLDGPEAQALMLRGAAWLDDDGDLVAFVRSWGATIASSGGLALAALWLRGKMVALPANPAKLVAALARRASIGDFSDKLSFRDRFGRQFSEVCGALRTRTSPGLVILIDDLDRCQPEDTLKILEAVNYFVSAGPCIVVLGMDRRQVEYCVGLGFEKLVDGLPEDELADDELVQGVEEAASKAAKQRAFARLYLEKLVNIEVPVPELSEEVLEAMLGGPEPEPEPEAEQPS